MKKQSRKKNTKLAKAVAPAATVTSALLSPLAIGAPGDLDPSFGDVGRLGPILDAPAWSMQVQDDDSILLSGSNVIYYYYYYWWGGATEVNNFVGQFPGSGSATADFLSSDIEGIEVFDVARLSDGRLVAVGRNHFYTRALALFRLEQDGTLDQTFGESGALRISLGDVYGSHIATSIVVEPDDRMVIAGVAGEQLTVLRLLPDGSFDDSFGDMGVFMSPDITPPHPYGHGFFVNLLRTTDGSYRVSASGAAGCQVVGLTAAGQLDNAFGDSGIAPVDAPGTEPAYCNSMAAQGDGKLLLAGTSADHGFVTRTLADGQPDATFSTENVWNGMQNATAVAAAPDGTIAVAGTGLSGTSIMRLQASGELDALFGDGGTTIVDLQSDFYPWYTPIGEVHEMSLEADGGIVAAGGISSKAFVIKLLGDGGSGSPGVLGIANQSPVSTAEGIEYAVVNVRRTGGSSGEVSVAYRAEAYDTYVPPALVGLDYVGVEGRLTWPDGDTAEQQIQIPIVTDDVTEEQEQFLVRLEDVQGGAGLGAAAVSVFIEADGNPYGQIWFVQDVVIGGEGGKAMISVCRYFYDSGAVSVTATPVRGTASPSVDFDPTPITVTWTDQDGNCKSIGIPIRDDSIEEETEEFTVELSNATGGVIIGKRSVATVRILANDIAVKHHGGSTDPLSLLLIGIAGILRRARRFWPWKRRGRLSS